MREEVITRDKIEQDIYLFACNARNIRRKVMNTFPERDLRTLLCSIFDKEGFNYTINKDGKEFIITVSPIVSLKGWLSTDKVGDEHFEIGVMVTCGDITVDFSAMRYCSVDIYLIDLEKFSPLYRELIELAKQLSDKYYELLQLQKNTDLLDIIIKSYLEQHSVEDVYVKPMKKRDDIYIIEKTVFGVTLQAKVTFSNYEEVCSNFIAALNRLPNDFKPQSTVVIECDNSINIKSKKSHIVASDLPEDFKMLYRDNNTNINKVSVDNTDLGASLTRYGFRYAEEADKKIIVIDLGNGLKLCRKGDYAFFRLEIQSFHKDFIMEPVDDATFIKILRLLAAASNACEFKLSPKDFDKAWFMYTIALLLNPLFPPEFTLTGEKGTSLVVNDNQNNIFINLNGNVFKRINDLMILVFKHDILYALRDFWRKEPKKSGIKMYVKAEPSGFYALTNGKSVRNIP